MMTFKDMLDLSSMSAELIAQITGHSIEYINKCRAALHADAPNIKGIDTKRKAIAAVKAEANGIIEQLERRAKGWDKGAYRDDDTMRFMTIRESLTLSSQFAFAVAIEFNR
jgi:hypothetical protein